MTAGGEFWLKACARELRTHQRRGIVEQHDGRAFGGGAIIRREMGIKIGARQRAGGLALHRGRRAHPLQELTNDHDPTDATMAAFPWSRRQISRR
jgi:hypothetical protein